MFRYPDTPGREIAPAFIDQISPELYLGCQKIDGWRTLLTAKDGVFTYRSRVGKPIVVPEKVRIPFEDFVCKCFCPECNTLDVILDCELTGKRREGDAQAIFILDLLRVQGTDLYHKGFEDRLKVLLKFVPRENPYLCPFTESGFRAFWDFHKQNTPLAEGVIFKLRSGKYIGSTKSAAKNPGFIKTKWRKGSDGLSPNE